MHELSNLQQWLQASILTGRSAQVSEYLVSDTRLSAQERLLIYARGYRARLIECLRNEYPLLAALAGPTAFELFAQGYIAAQPPHSYTLYAFGAGFADYLQAVRPVGDGTPQTVQAIPAALARLERAKAEVHRARGLERATALAAEPDTYSLLDRTLALHVCRYQRPDSVRLLALPFDFTATLDAASSPPPLPQPTPWFAAVARSRYRVRCHSLEDWQHAWLSYVPDATSAASVPPPADARLTAWLPAALHQGLVRLVQPPD